jgi:predicted nucleotidyltransferase
VAEQLRIRRLTAWSDRELAAREAQRTLLVLDTASGDAERLYARHGWQRCGEIPGYALFPDGRPCATTIFFKPLERA